MGYNIYLTDHLYGHGFSYSNVHGNGFGNGHLHDSYGNGHYFKQRIIKSSHDVNLIIKHKL